MDEKRISPDSVIGPMLCSQKKDKTCLVCGDKALGYNFNAISCESCKAFFRRNAHKTIRGRCEGKCDINIESRSFCKRCRLAKCFTMGMRKDMILDDNQKKLRKQKILINKLRRHGTLPPGDTYAVSESDVQETYSQNLLTQSEDSLREQYPNLSETEIQTLCNAGKSAAVDKKVDKLDFREKLCRYQPWQDVEEVIQDLGDTEKTVIMEMNKAHDNSAFLSNTHTRLKNLPKNPTEVFNIADGFVRRIIKVAKQLSFFRMINKDDQIALLKGSVVEIMMLRSAVNFDVRTETWNLSTVSCIKPSTSSDTASNISSPDSACSLSEPFELASPPPGAPPGVPPGLDINQLREAAMQGADFSALREMARRHLGGEAFDAERNRPTLNLDRVQQKFGLNIEQMKQKYQAQEEDKGLEQLRNAAKAAGFDVDALREAAMKGASFEQLSKMAHSGDSKEAPLNMTVKKEPMDEAPSGSGNCISSEILKHGNPETKTMFLTYSKFIRSLMSTIYGDLMILKFLIMLSLFSPDRPGIEDKATVEKYQEVYANALKKYIDVRFPEEKNMFARCIMKLTDLRNVNEVHTKMLLKMHVEEIEPLLVEIFDLPQ